MTHTVLGLLVFAARAWRRTPVVHAQPDAHVSRKGAAIHSHRIPLVLGISALVMIVGGLGLAQAMANHEIVTSSGGGLQQPTCPGSKKVLGGGAWAGDGTALYRTGPQAGGTGWAANAQNDNAITAYAVCANVDASYEIVTSSGGGLQQPTCPGLKKVLGGGAWAGDGTALYRTGPQAGGTGWAANAQNDNAITAYAICAHDLAAVGGIAELPEVPVVPFEGSASSAPNLGVLAGLSAVGALLLTAGASYARRRWLRRRA